MTHIEVEGKKYKVINDLGWMTSVQKFGKEVETPEGKRLAIKNYGGYDSIWRWWK